MGCVGTIVVVVAPRQCPDVWRAATETGVLGRLVLLVEPVSRGDWPCSLAAADLLRETTRADMPLLLLDPMAGFSDLRAPQRVVEEALLCPRSRRRAVVLVQPSRPGKTTSGIPLRRGERWAGSPFHVGEPAKAHSETTFESLGAVIAWTDTLSAHAERVSPAVKQRVLACRSLKRRRDGSIWLPISTWARCPHVSAQDVFWSGVVPPLLRTVLAQPDVTPQDHHNTFVHASAGCTVRAQDHFVATVGCQNLHVVATGDATLVMPADADAATLQPLLDALREADRPELFDALDRPRDWGREVRMDGGRGWSVARLEQRPETVLRRAVPPDEELRWTVLEGQGYAAFESAGITLRPGTSFALPPSGIRRCEVDGATALKILETRRNSATAAVAMADA